MADGFQFRLDLDAEQRRIQRLALFLQDLRSFWPTVVPLVTGWWRSQFESEGQFAGRPWAPLSPAYANWKAAAYPGKGILQAAGALRQAASRPERDAQPRSLTLTITDDKLPYHQTGTRRMPTRPLVFDTLPPFAERELESAADRYIADLLRRL